MVFKKIHTMRELFFSKVREMMGGKDGHRMNLPIHMLIKELDAGFT